MDNRFEDEETQTEAQMHVQAIEAGWSSTEEESTCACRGSGWILSQLDTFHTCRVHYAGQPHPEFEEEEGGPCAASYPEEPTCTCGGLCPAGVGCYTQPAVDEDNIPF